MRRGTGYNNTNMLEYCLEGYAALKLITFTVPCYNSAEYMARCVDSLLSAGDEAEIILVDDGSSDATGAIADRYASAHENVRAIHQENGGHGEGVNQGLRNATGLYFKVVDSDDWLDVDALRILMDRLRRFAQLSAPVDLIVCNYVYEHASDGTRRVMRYRKALPEGCVIGWEDTRRFSADEFICMHAAIYRTGVLRDSGLTLPRHTFYVDNLFVYQPLPWVRTLADLDIDLYRYFIGREDQSITEANLIARIDQQILVTRLLIDAHDLDALRKAQPKLARYMEHNLAMQLMICTIFLWLSDTPENIEKADALWDDLRWRKTGLYRRLRWRSWNICLLPGKAGRKIDLFVYRQIRRRFKFN